MPIFEVHRGACVGCAYRLRRQSSSNDQIKLSEGGT